MSARRRRRRPPRRGCGGTPGWPAPRARGRTGPLRTTGRGMPRLDSASSVGLGGEGGVGAAIGAVADEVLLEDAGAEAGGHDRRGRPGGVVRQPDRHVPAMRPCRGWRRRSISAGLRGYAELQRRSTMPPSPPARAASTASSISSAVAIPVEMISGRPVEAAWAISAWSSSSNEAILWAGGSNCSRKSTAARSNGSRSRQPERRPARTAGVPLPWGLRLVVEVVEGAALPEGAGTHDERRTGEIERHAVGRVGLELHGIRTGLGGEADDLLRGRQRAAVVGRQLGDDVGHPAGTDDLVAARRSMVRSGPPLIAIEGPSVPEDHVIGLAISSKSASMKAPTERALEALI